MFEVTSGTLTLTDCKKNGKVTRSSGDYVCGVYVNGGTFNLYEGQITGNTGQKDKNNDCCGGGVYVGNGGTFNMYDGVITGNSASYGGGVYVKSGKFEMNGGTITDNTSNRGGGDGSGGAGVYVEKSGNFIMNNAASVTGNKIKRLSNGGGVYVNGGNFTMNGTSSVTNNIADYSDGALNGGGVYVSGGNFEMNNNASVTGNEANQGTALNGAGVYVSGTKSTFIMNGNSSVTNNEASGNKDGDGKGDGGGVYVSVRGEDSKFEMNYNASVTGNKATNYGGGVHVNNGTFTMNANSSVTDNKAKNGGGVYTSGGTFAMNGSSKVTNNTDAGVYVNSGTFTVSGGATVTENKDRNNANNNVYLPKDKTITIGGTLDEGASIGVTKDSSSVIANNVSADYSGKFSSDDSKYVVKYDNKQLVLAEKSQPPTSAHTHEWTFTKEKGNDSTIFVSCKGATGDCAYRNTPADVKISMAREVYDYEQITEAPKAVLTYSDNWPEGVAKAQESQIVYYKSADDGTSYTGPVTNKNELKKPGKYAALLYFNGKYLEAYFSVVDTSKKDPPYSAPTPRARLTYTGEPQVLINGGSVEGGKMQYSLTSGGDYSDSLPTATNAGTYTVWYKVVGDATHNDVPERSIEVRIEKAPLSGTPTFTKVTEAGKTLKNVTLTKPESWPEGTFDWGDGATETSKDTQILQGKEYWWHFNATNHSATGKIVPWANPSSGGGTTGGTTGGSTGGSSGGSSSGGGSSSDRDSSDSNPIIKTETKNNPDGSTTKTETRRDGSVTQTTTAKDGSTSKTETKKDGSSVTENKAADGSTGTVKTDKNGQTEAKTALSGKAVEDAKKSGEAVKAPVEVEATRNSNTAPTVKVELPKGAGETKVEIPVSNVKPGTVAVLVHADGTEEILKDSIPTEDGIQLTVNGGATVKIVDNSKDFIDTRNHWAKDEIDFVSARGLVNGMSDTIYAPNASTTRAQLWTILARQNDTDLTGGSIWYEKAQDWVKKKGISDGANPDAFINRAQMVTMLWQAMGQPAAGSTANFIDVPADAYYASAVAWAVENGITTGVGNGRFDPTGTCTRAQIAAFLYRYMK